MKGKWIKYIAVLAALFLVVTLLRGCCDALLVSYREVYTSPPRAQIPSSWNMIMYVGHMSTKRSGSGKSTFGLTRGEVLWRQCFSGWNGFRRIKSE